MTEGKKKERENLPFQSRARPLSSYFVISSYLPTNKSERALSPRHPFWFMTELILDPPKISSIYRVTRLPPGKLGWKKRRCAHEPVIRFKIEYSSIGYTLYLWNMPRISQGEAYRLIYPWSFKDLNTSEIRSLNKKGEPRLRDIWSHEASFAKKNGLELSPGLERKNVST